MPDVFKSAVLEAKSHIECYTCCFKYLKYPKCLVQYLLPFIQIFFCVCVTNYPKMGYFVIFRKGPFCVLLKAQIPNTIKSRHLMLINYFSQKDKFLFYHNNMVRYSPNFNFLLPIFVHNSSKTNSYEYLHSSLTTYISIYVDTVVIHFN